MIVKRKAGRVPWMLAGLILLLAGLCRAAGDCSRLDDAFDTLDQNKWRVVLNLSPNQGKAMAYKGRLKLESPGSDPREVAVYSRFALSGDFDFSVDYALDEPGDSSKCRFNAGVVVATEGDGVAYKCYVARAPGQGLFYRVRLDTNGVVSREKTKLRPALSTGKLRISRKKGRLVFYTWDERHGWKQAYKFSGRCRQPLFVRFKLQTGGQVKDWRNACPTGMFFDNFTVKKCAVTDADGN